MSHARAVGRLLILAPFTLVMYLIYLVTRVLRLVSSRRALVVKAWCFQTWSRGVVHTIGLTVHQKGGAPPTPFFLVTNHSSYLDVIVLSSCAPCWFVAKSEVARWPVLGYLAQTMNTIFIDRSLRADVPRVVRRMQNALGADQGIVFFPEGTSSDGTGVLPFKSSLFEAPASLGADVWCGRLNYTSGDPDRPAVSHVCWWGDMGFVGHFYGLLQIPAARVDIEFHPKPVAAADRKTMAQRTFDVVSKGLSASVVEVPVVESGGLARAATGGGE